MSVQGHQETSQSTASPSAMRERLVAFLRTHSVIRSEDEPIVSSTGKPIKWLLDTRIALLNPEMSVAIGSLYWAYLERFLPFQMCCMEMTGIPLMMGVQALAMRRGYAINGFVIRKERKPTGRRRQIEGTINELPIVFLDDIVNSGDSLERAIITLSNYSRSIAHVVALVDFGTGPVGETLLRRGIHLRSLIRLEELGVSKSARPSHQISRRIFRELWKFSPVDRSYFDVVPKSSPILDDSRIFYGTDHGNLYALNRITGLIEWCFKAGVPRFKGIRSSPLVEGDLVYFGAYDGVLYALEKDTGRLRWQFTEADWIGSSPCCAPKWNSLYVGLEHAQPGYEGSLIALDLRSGIKKWTFKTDSFVHGSPLYIEEQSCVVVGNNEGWIYSVDACAGTLRWSYKTEGPIKSRACYDATSGLVIAGSFDKHVYAWDAATGELAWRVHTEGIIYSEPLMVDDYVYVCSTDKHLYVLHAKDGSVVTRLHVGAKLLASPSISGGRIYFGSTSGTVFEFDHREQELTGLHMFPEKITNKISCDTQTNHLFITTIDGQLVACQRS